MSERVCTAASVLVKPTCKAKNIIITQLWYGYRELLENSGLKI